MAPFRPNTRPLRNPSPTKPSRRARRPAAADAAFAAGEFAALIEAALEKGASWPGAVAVSGGGDSTALMVLAAEWASAAGRAPPVVLTVDHGLRAESSDEAASAVEQAKALDLEAHVLVWRGRKPKADIENAARVARYRLMGDWCRNRGIGSVYLGHTLEDQAETFLLRLARGSGVDGLAAMSAVSAFPRPDCGALRLVRPLLAVPRARLRSILMERHVPWQDDPMNGEKRFARVRIRMAWPEFVQLGLTPARIAEATEHLSRAKAALDHDTETFLARASLPHKAGMLLDGAGLAALPDEIGLRTLARVLMQVSGQVYRPRLERLEGLLSTIRAETLGKGRTLHGCWLRPAPSRDQRFGPTTLWIASEPARRRMVGNNEA